MPRLLAIMFLVGIVMVSENQVPNISAACSTSTRGATLCAGQSSIPVNNTTTNYMGPAFYLKENPDVNITLGCGPQDIDYGSYSSTCFQPNVLVVRLGADVEWKNEDILPHSVTYGNPWLPQSTGYFFDSGTLEPGQTFTHKFSYLGAYPYFDAFDSWETGLVIVKK